MTSSAPSTPEGSGTQTIARAAQVLACFSAERPHLKLVELSRAARAQPEHDLSLPRRPRVGWPGHPRPAAGRLPARAQGHRARRDRDQPDRGAQARARRHGPAVRRDGPARQPGRAVRGRRPPHRPRRAARGAAELHRARSPRGRPLHVARQGDAGRPAATQQVHAIIERYGWRPYTEALDPRLRPARRASWRAPGPWATRSTSGSAGPASSAPGPPIRDFSGHAAAAVSVSVRRQPLRSPRRSRRRSPRRSWRPPSGSRSAWATSPRPPSSDRARSVRRPVRSSAAR